MAQANGLGRGKGGQTDAGQSLVEFAFALPILLVMLFGIMEFGLVQMNRTHLANAARDGARAGAIHFESAPIPIPDADRVAQAKSAAQTSAGGIVSCPLQTPTVTPDKSGNPWLITVQVQCTYSPVTPLGNLVTLFAGSLNLSTTLQAKSTRFIEP